MRDTYNLQCLSHNPPVTSESIDGYLASGSSGLDRLRVAVAERAHIVRLYRETDGEWPPMDERDRHWTAMFLAGHPDCAIGIIDEYGTTHSVEVK